MGFENEEEPTPEEVAPKPKHSIRNIAIGVATIAIVLVAVFAYLHFSGSAQTSWLKTGTYAVYEGATTDSTGQLNLTVRLEIVDLNATYANIQMSANGTTQSGTVESPITTIWLERQSMKYSIADQNLTGTGEASIQYDSKGTKNCNTYQFYYSETTTTLYVDKESRWILKMTFSSGPTNIALNLIETNIAGL